MFPLYFLHIYGENIMKNLSFLTLRFPKRFICGRDEPVDEDVEVVAEATMAESSERQKMKMFKS